MLNSGLDGGTAGMVVGVDACRQLDAHSQPEKIPLDFQLSIFVSKNEQGEPLDCGKNSSHSPSNLSGLSL